MLKVEKSETRVSKICDIRLVVPGNDLLAGARSNTFEEAAMMAIGIMERQIHKKKTKLKSENKRSNKFG